MLIARYVISILYAALMLIAVIFDFRKSKKLDYIMMLGALLLIVSNFLSKPLSLGVAIISLLLIHVAALINGKNNGKINPQHHIIRFVISVGIFILFWFG